MWCGLEGAGRGCVPIWRGICGFYPVTSRSHATPPTVFFWTVSGLIVRKDCYGWLPAGPSVGTESIPFVYKTGIVRILPYTRTKGMERYRDGKCEERVERELKDTNRERKGNDRDLTKKTKSPLYVQSKRYYCVYPYFSISEDVWASLPLSPNNTEPSDFFSFCFFQSSWSI